MRVSEQDQKHEEAGRLVMMKDVKKILAVALFCATLSAGSLAAQPQREQREPPPKDPKVFDKKEKEPRREEPRREPREQPREGKREKP
jgi:hypothetical protein